MRFVLFLLLTIIVSALKAQNPYKDYREAIGIRYSSSQPVINYTLEVDTNSLSFINIEMKIKNAADTFRIGMFVHPEYDDRFYRFVEDLQIEGGTIQRLENTLWRVQAKSEEVVIRYKIHLPQERKPRAAWRPFLSSTGGLIGGPQCYMYVVGATLAPSYVHINLPLNWKIATGLESTADPFTFFAPTADVLFDSPILVGELKQWDFQVDGVPHKISYWPSANFKLFDTIALISNIQKLVHQANNLFGRLPYRDYNFLFQDEAYGALEHANSVTIGLPSGDMINNTQEYLSEIAHEYVHSWNLVRIRPIEYGDISYTKPPLSKGLWWGEGLTMFYADVLLRRAGIITSPRTDHLKNLIARYFSNPGNNKLSAENVSMASYAPPGFSGDYDGSTHLQGELIGTMLDLFIRDATDNRKSMDDVMRKMMERFSGSKGFTGKDIEDLVKEISGKNAHSFFEDHIRGNKPIDFNRFLQLAGLKYEIKWIDARSGDGKDVPDIRVYAFTAPDQKAVLLGINNPSGPWGKAALHTNDEILFLNDSAITSTSDFYKTVRAAKTGDRFIVKIKRQNKILQTTVNITGYQRPDVTIEKLSSLSPKQQQLLTKWERSE